jgi:arylamine N-acetyltransferase
MEAMNSVGSEEIPHSRSKRPLYSSTQLSAYFARVGLPESYLSTNPGDPAVAHTEDHGLAFLAVLMRHHLAAIPFENLSMHYSLNRGMTLDMQEIYSIFTEHGRGRGGHCMQMNGLFGTVLSSLGFHVTTVAARVNTACQAVARNPGYKGPSYNGW